MAEEGQTRAKEEDNRFRSMIIAYHLGEAKKVLDIIDGTIEEEASFAPELSEEEMLEYQPYSEEEAQQAVDMLRKFGVAVQ
jgi:hypothetical protein